MFNRFKLGRTLDEAHAYGCNLLFEELALAVCTHEGIDLRFNHLDTTSFSLTGDYIPESDEHAICITHGYSKDHRPDLKQAVLELMVSQDGGIPFVSKSWDGNTSDTRIFQERAEALLSAFKTTPSPRYLIADAKLYCEDNVAHLAKLGFITRIPATLKVVAQVISQALQWDTWQPVDPTHPLSASCAGPLWHGPALAGGVFTGGFGACGGHAEESQTARKRGHHTSNSFTSKPNALAHPKPLKRPWRPWPSAGSITTWRPLI